MAAIEIRNLVKTYGEVEAVRGIDLAIESGEVFALLGPNGAGKTTTVEILEGFREPSSGAVKVLGYDPADNDRDFKERIGIVLQETSVEDELSVREALEIYGGLYPSRLEPDDLIEIVGLEEKADARVKTLSGGQKRRLEMALGIVGDPEVIFLDEPTTGFDPSARRRAWTVIENLSNLGKTILLTTHYMDEAENLADRVAIISSGEIVAEGTPETLGGRRVAETVIRFIVSEDAFDSLPIQPMRVEGRFVEFSTKEPTRHLHELTSWALERQIELEGLSVTMPTLEDVYLELAGEAGA